jgi:aminoglycoside phosphotransferase (APT) family kinase protein
MRDAGPFTALAGRLVPGGRLVRAWPLTGGVSAHVDALEIARPDGTTERVVVRRHGAIDKGHDPEIATDEYRLLSTLHGAGLPVPKPILVDPSGEIFERPCLVVEHIDGVTEVAPDAVPDAIRTMADLLARLHAIDPAPLDLGFLPRREDPIAGVLAYLSATPEPDRVRAAVTDAALARANVPALLHGDYWPGNILWRDGGIAAVIDWEDAAVDDPVIDLAGARVELLWAYGEEAMDAFTGHYLERHPIDLADLPLWELYVGASGAAHMGEWGLEPEIEAGMRRKAGHVIQRALNSLA